MTKRKRTEIIKDIATDVAELSKPVAELYKNQYSELKMLKMDYLPNPFEIADYFKIKYKFIKIEDGKLSFLSEGIGTIYISDKYIKDSYKSKILCAHELGHYFRHGSHSKHYFRSGYLIEEYEANVFAILLMPQIMAGQPWETYNLNQLNQVVYNKILEN